jgi:hypothetical protein
VGRRDGSREIGGYVCGQGSEHLRTLVDADQLRLWMDVEHSAGRLPSADAGLELPPSDLLTMDAVSQRLSSSPAGTLEAPDRPGVVRGF